MDTNTRKNLMGAAAGGSSPSGQFILQGYYDDDADHTATKLFTVPDDVTSICAVCVGAGKAGKASLVDADGGEGGDLRYVNDISVSPGDVLQLGAGLGWYGDADEMGTSINLISGGKSSWLKRQTGTDGNGNPIYETLCYAQGGDNEGTNVGTGTDALVGADGNTGYAGSGSASGTYTDDDTNDAPPSNQLEQGSMGGGVGLTGTGETVSSVSVYQNVGGSYGGSYSGGGPFKGNYGGGGGGYNLDHVGGDTDKNRLSHGAVGATRIIWGNNRSFPNAARGVFKTAPAGTELEIRFVPPITYINEKTHSTLAVRFRGLEIFDDTGTNLVEATSNQIDDGSYDGIPVLMTDAGGHYNGEMDWDGVTGATPNGTILDFDDAPGPPGVVLNNTDGTAAFTFTHFEKLVDTDKVTSIGNSLYGDLDGNTQGLNWQLSDKDHFDSDMAGSTITNPHSEVYYSNSFLIKFASAKVIKKIHIYTQVNASWVPPLKILLDGNVIAEDAAHFIDPDTDEGHQSNYINQNCRLAVFEFT